MFSNFQSRKKSEILQQNVEKVLIAKTVENKRQCISSQWESVDCKSLDDVLYCVAKLLEALEDDGNAIVIFLASLAALDGGKD